MYNCSKPAIVSVISYTCVLTVVTVSGLFTASRSVCRALWKMMNIVYFECKRQRLMLALFCPFRSPSLTLYLWMRSWHTSHIQRTPKSKWLFNRLLLLLVMNINESFFTKNDEWLLLSKMSCIFKNNINKKASSENTTALTLCWLLCSGQCWHRRL